MMNELEKSYSNHYSKSELNATYPNEFLVRIFLGNYPNLNLEGSFKSKKVLDLGMGDGRNLKFLCKLGFYGFGVEITREIVNHVSGQFLKTDYRPNLKVGKTNDIPFESNYFDYVISWNSSYYMGYENYFSLIEDHFKEISRVLKSGGVLILSVPQLSDSLYMHSIDYKPGYKKIIDDYYGARRDLIMAYFESQNNLEKLLNPYFNNFSHGSTTDDCFGMNKHSYLVVCKKK